MADFLFGIFSSSYYIGTFLNLFVLISFSTLGNCISLRAGFYNLGGEGQIYLAGFVSSLLLVYFDFIPPMMNFILSFLITIFITGFFSVLSAICNDIKKASVLLVSYIFSAAIIPIIDSLISGSFRGDFGNLLATQFIPNSVRLQSILKPSPLNFSIFIVPISCVLLYFVFQKSKYGFELSLWGTSKEFAKYSGLSYRKTLYSSLFLDGALHGVAGFLSIVGLHFTCHVGFVNGLGWNALTCALLASKNPIFVIPASLFLAWILSSATRFSLVNNLSLDISGIIQGVIIFLVAGKEIYCSKILKKLLQTFSLKNVKTWNKK